MTSDPKDIKGDYLQKWERIRSKGKAKYILAHLLLWIGWMGMLFFMHLSMHPLSVHGLSRIDATYYQMLFLGFIIGLPIIFIAVQWKWSRKEAAYLEYARWDTEYKRLKEKA
jgi:hypothetical protein